MNIFDFNFNLLVPDFRGKVIQHQMFYQRLINRLDLIAHPGVMVPYQPNVNGQNQISSYTVQGPAMFEISHDHWTPHGMREYSTRTFVANGAAARVNVLGQIQRNDSVAVGCLDCQWRLPTKPTVHYNLYSNGKVTAQGDLSLTLFDNDWGKIEVRACPVSWDSSENMVKFSDYVEMYFSTSFVDWMAKKKQKQQTKAVSSNNSGEIEEAPFSSINSGEKFESNAFALTLSDTAKINFVTGTFASVKTTVVFATETTVSQLYRLLMDKVFQFSIGYF